MQDKNTVWVLEDFESSRGMDEILGKMGNRVSKRQNSKCESFDYFLKKKNTC